MSELHRHLTRPMCNEGLSMGYVKHVISEHYCLQPAIVKASLPEKSMEFDPIG